MDDSDDSSSTSSGLSNDDPIGDIGDNQMPDTKKDHEEKEEHEVQVVLTTDTENLIKKEEPPNTDRNNTAGNMWDILKLIQFSCKFSCISKCK